MSYLVIKWRKGIPYLYEQTTYRDGGKVKTISVYIGRASEKVLRSGDNKIITTKKTTIDETLLNTASKLEEVSSKIDINNQIIKEREKIADVLTKKGNEEKSQIETIKSKNAQSVKVQTKKDGEVATTKNTANKAKQIKYDKFENKINLSEYKINRNSLEREQQRMALCLHKIGLDISKLEKIKLVNSGQEPGYKKKSMSLLSSEQYYEVNMTRYVSGNRTKFKTSFKRALASSALDMLEKQKPGIYSNIMYYFDRSYQNTQNLLNTYILNTNDRNRKTKALIVKGIFGKLGGYIPEKLQGKKIKPEEIGLVDQTRRKTWKDDAVIVLAEMIGSGYTKFISDRKTEYEKAKREQNNAKVALQQARFYEVVKKGYAKKRFKKACARYEAQKEMMNKIKYLTKIFKHV